MWTRLRKLFGSRNSGSGQDQDRQKLFLDIRPDVIYAIGDIHGCLDQLLRLEAKIVADAAAETGDKHLFMLGDYVDRGPDSAGVLDHISMRSKHGIATHHLAGNHEDVMLDFLRHPHGDHEWLRFGGTQTLNSYGIYTFPENRRGFAHVLKAHIPEEHITFLESLPSLISVADICMVHAGIDSAIDLKDQKDSVLLWKRPQDNGDGPGPLVVHGHTPVPAVEIHPFRINVDTGSYATGLLSAVKIKKTGEISVIASD